MGRCMGYTKEGKRCSRTALSKEVYCSQHIKNSAGKSRKLTVTKCQGLRKTSRSPFSKRILKKDGRTYRQIYETCRARMDHLVKRLESKKDLPESLAKYAKDLKKEWVRTRKVATAKSS